MTSFNNKKTTVGVIGAGPAGLTAIKELKAVGGIEVIAWEKGSEIGGLWATSSSTKNGVWEELTMNVNRRYLEFSDFPWDPKKYSNEAAKAHYGIFPHHSETKAYLQDYARHFELESCIQFNTKVTQIHKNENGSWTIDTTKKTETVDALVLCTGLNAQAYHPLKDTLLKEYTGTVLHSQDFGSAQDPLFNGGNKKILVVGGGISGSDIASVLCRESKSNNLTIHHAVRNMPYHVHVVSPTSRQPYDDVLLQRLPAVWLSNTLPSKLSSFGLKQAVLMDWPTQPTQENCGHTPNSDIRNNLFFPDRYWMQLVLDGSITVQQGVASAQGKTVTFADGKTEDFDVIICATGYLPDFSYLPKEVQESVTFINEVTQKKDLGLYKMTLPPNGDASLAFCGYHVNYGPHFSMAEMQSRWIAQLYGGQLDWPSAEELRAGTQKLIQHRNACLLNKGDVPANFTDDIGKLLGVTPTVWQCLKSPKKLLLSPTYASIYRTNPKVDGPEVAARAQARFEELLANPQVLDNV